VRYTLFRGAHRCRPQTAQKNNNAFYLYVWLHWECYPGSSGELCTCCNCRCLSYDHARLRTARAVQDAKLWIVGWRVPQQRNQLGK
jgi:hypothetical protein